jgi:hypothetical protein
MPDIQTITAGSATISLRNACISPSLVVDELVLEAGDLELTPGLDGRDLTFSSGETRFRGMLTEVSVNKLISGNMPADTPLRNVKVTLYSGRAQVKGQFVKSVMSLPFTLDAKPVLTNGIRLTLDCSASQIGGIGLPGAVVEIIERVLNEKLSLDLTQSAFPVRLDEVRCEPGRLTVLGRARLNWPPDRSLVDAHPNPDSGAVIESK